MRQQVPFNRYNVPPGAGILGMPKGKPVFTRKTEMDKKLYINMALKKALRKYWFAFFVPPALLIPGFIWPSSMIWMVVTSIVVTILYVLFWYMQFYGMTILPQGKQLFEKQLFAILPEYIGVMKSEKDPQGMMLPYDKIEQVEKTGNSYIIHLTMAHIVIMPFDIFQSQQDMNYFEALLRKYKLLPGKAE